MALKTVYDADGKPFSVEPVDAREYVKSGAYSYTPPEEAKPARAKAAKADPEEAKPAEVKAE